MKESGNLKELMILLRFLPRAIISCFIKGQWRQSSKSSFSCSAGAARKGATLALCPGKGHSPGAVPRARDWKSEQEFLSQNLFRPVMSCEPLSLTQNVLYKYLLVYRNYLGIGNS